MFYCLWLELVPSLTLLDSVSNPRSPTLSWFQEVRGLLQASSPLVGKVCRSLKISSASWLRIKAGTDLVQEALLLLWSIYSPARSGLWRTWDRRQQSHLNPWVSALPRGHLSFGRKGAQNSEDQLCLLAKDEGQNGPCPRSSVVSVVCVLSCVVWSLRDSGYKMMISPESWGDSPPWRTTLLCWGKCTEVWGSAFPPLWEWRPEVTLSKKLCFFCSLLALLRGLVSQRPGIEDGCGAIGYAQSGLQVSWDLEPWWSPMGGNFHLHGMVGIRTYLLDPWLLSKLWSPQPPQESFMVLSHIDNVPSFWPSG
jgi:hypothetical protein